MSADPGPAAPRSDLLVGGPGTNDLPRVVHLVLGPAEHGVAAHALGLAGAAGEPVVHLPAPSPPPLSLVLARVAAVVGPHDSVHAHVTDRLFGPTADAAAELVEAVARAYPLTVTLHDLPQESDGRHHAARRDAYRRIARAAIGVQLSSRHEQRLLAAIDPSLTSTVVPLPVPVPQVRRSAGQAGPAPHPLPPTATEDNAPMVAVLGFLYPGKGHAEVLAALDRLGRPDIDLVALGRPSDGHEWLVNELTRRAGDRRLTVTGYLDEATLDSWIDHVDVPVVAPTHVSASGSVHRWIGAGRRPVAVRTAYTTELDAAMPGCVRLTDDLAAGIARALEDPADTRLDRSYRWDGAAAAAAQSAAISSALGVVRPDPDDAGPDRVDRSSGVTQPGRS